MTEIKSMPGVGVEMAQKDSRREILQKGLMIVGGVAVAGLSIFAAVKGLKQKQFGALLGENKQGLRVFKKVGKNGKEVLTTVDSETNKVVKRITKESNPNLPQFMHELGYSAFPRTNAKSSITHIENLKNGENIDRVYTTWLQNGTKRYNLESVKRNNTALEKFSFSGYSAKGRMQSWNSYRSKPDGSVIEKFWDTCQNPRLDTFTWSSGTREVEITDKYLLDIINKA